MARSKVVEFDERRHKYFHEGKEFFGVTPAICDILERKYPNIGIARVMASYGSQIHKEVERYYNYGIRPTSKSALWILSKVEEILRGTPESLCFVNSEVTVSDLEVTASNIDLVIYKPDVIVLVDIKTGTFDREYCTYQLNAYRNMYLKTYEGEQRSFEMLVFATKSERVYKILQNDEYALRVLNKNKEKKNV